MPDSPDHLDPKEATEARLCAYLEGELSADERADIENHLKANPQHRQLLIDLSGTREWMRSIPRESAPPDLAEAFAAQMERSLLLDYRAAPSGSSFSRVSQYMLLAAIVTLTLGLGVLIAFMLNSGKSYTAGPASPPGSLGVGRTSTTSPATDEPIDTAIKTTLPQPTPPPEKDAVAGPSPLALAPTTPHLLARREVSPPLGEMAPGVSAPDAAVAETPTNPDLAKVEGVLRDRKISTDRKTICLMVTSPKPSATAGQVHRFFNNQQIVFDDEPGDGGPFAAIIPPSDELTQNNTANNAANNAVQNTAEQAAPDQLQNSANFVGANRGGQQKQAAMKKAVVAPGTRPSLASPDAKSAVLSDQLVYVGHALTPLQVELLHGTLAAGTVDQTVKRFDLPSTSETAGPTVVTMPAGSLVVKGQTLTITVPQLVGPGIEKTNVVKVSDDGMVILPMLDPLPAAGVSAAELQARIAAKYREANLIPAATVTVVMTPPTTSKSATQPSASQPSADDKMDVVVYVRKGK